MMKQENKIERQARAAGKPVAEYVREVLSRNRFSMTRTARELGVSRQWLYVLMESRGIER